MVVFIQIVFIQIGSIQIWWGGGEMFFPVVTVIIIIVIVIVVVVGGIGLWRGGSSVGGGLAGRIGVLLAALGSVS